jgi:hypothetical protein
MIILLVIFYIQLYLPLVNDLLITKSLTFIKSIGTHG